MFNRANKNIFVKNLANQMGGRKFKSYPLFFHNSLSLNDFQDKKKKLLHELKNMSNSLNDNIETAFSTAVDSNKKLLIIVGENHFDARSLIVAIIVLHIIKKYSIKNVITEASNELIQTINLRPKDGLNFSHLIPIVRNFNMKLIPADLDHRLPDLVRESAMKNTLLSLNDHGYFIVGSNHLPNFKSNQKLLDKYEVVIINVPSSDHQLELDKKISTHQRLLLDIVTDPYFATQAKIITDISDIPHSVLEDLTLEFCDSEVLTPIPML